MESIMALSMSHNSLSL